MKSKKNKFKEDINQAKYQKQIMQLVDKQRDLGVKNTFFPFTHGDHIERQRDFIRTELKEDLQTKFYKVQQPGTTSANHSQDNQSQMSTTEKFKSDDLRTKFVQDYPKFLKAHTHVMNRKPNEDSVQDAMHNARERYENKLLDNLKTKKQQEQEQLKYVEEH